MTSFFNIHSDFCHTKLYTIVIQVYTPPQFIFPFIKLIS